MRSEAYSASTSAYRGRNRTYPYPLPYSDISLSVFGIPVTTSSQLSIRLGLIAPVPAIIAQGAEASKGG